MGTIEINMIRFTLCWFFVAVSAPRIDLPYDSDCFVNTIDGCLNETSFDVKEMTRTHVAEKAFPKHESLFENCESLNLFINCGENNIQFCSKPNRDHFSKYTIPIKEICDENSNLRKVYKKHVNCINDNMQDVLDCKPEVWNQAMSKYENRSEYSTTVNHRIRYCLALFARSEICLFGIPNEKCGEEVHELVKKLFLMTENDFPNYCGEEEIFDEVQRLHKEIFENSSTEDNK